MSNTNYYEKLIDDIVMICSEKIDLFHQNGEVNILESLEKQLIEIYATSYNYYLKDLISLEEYEIIKKVVGAITSEIIYGLHHSYIFEYTSEDFVTIIDNNSKI